ncbi:MAG: dihydroxyacetone kinase family protein [Nitrosomonas sp.]|uniref:dihydroxyacetone kinase family protein n=1 Tax=Nitrosomonas sp. TaxID=42353 RepID=UPI0027210EBE|nr:dihydroxyacetone kinase family protein [Nitrosomonas sp.]MDO8894399.1 dihydroxyacetone kinase family protein [Nitrosomonas sp.]MDP1549897.1 dihydroxyacetone kinase family protein [Nitrosomonas sp.]
MTYLFNDPTKFANELVEGLMAAHSSRLFRVDGGVIRRHKAKPGQVVLVIGGGSGHYPAFGGFVGSGMAHGAAMGNIFAAPSAQQICNVAQAVNAGGGILFCYGNYAGDVLNFNQAQERLRALGVDVRTVVVTDDTASAPFSEKHKRRGIAGTLPVFKAAAVAAASGKSLDDVFRIATAANDRVRTLGVAFSGCTLPGAEKPLFEVEIGKMEVGMGIHGEPGLYRLNATTADGLAALLVDKLLAEIPAVISSPKGARIGVIFNGLGAIKYEELFVVYRKIDQLLSARGLIIVEPEVGELITSFDMAGVSLTLFWMNDELEQTWIAAADAPAFRRGNVTPSSGEAIDTTVLKNPHQLNTGSKQSQAVAAVVFAAFEAAWQVIDKNQDELGRLDAIAGDGDHGIGMHRGLTAAVTAAKEALVAKAGAGTLLKVSGDAWSDQAGGTSGALWGVILRELGDVLGDEARPSTSAIAAGTAAALRGVTDLGKAQTGDKTMIDVLHPFAAALACGASRGFSIPDAWAAATIIADEAAQATAHLLPKIGRARPHAEKSIDSPDPGAISMALIIRSVGEVLAERCS